MTLIGHAYSSQFMEWQSLGFAAPKHAICAPNVFKIFSENQICTDFIFISSSNFVTVESTYMSFLTLLYMFILLQCHGDIEKNPDPRKLKIKSLSACYWNLNSLPAHNFSKLTQLKACISMYKHGFICLSETYLDSSVSDSFLKIDGYNLVRSDHPNDNKRGGVCIYYKESLSVRVMNLSYFEEALLLELTYHNKK